MRLAALLLIPLALLAQVRPNPSDGWIGIGGEEGPFGGIPVNGLEMLLTLDGSSPALNPGWRWSQEARNGLLSSGDLTTTWFVNEGATIDNATHVTFSAKFGQSVQNFGTAAGVVYTIYARMRRVTGNYDLLIRSSGLAIATTAITVTDTLADYVAVVTGDGDNSGIGIRDGNNAGHGQIEVTRWMVAVGTHDAATMAARYERTTNRKTVHDWSGAGNDGCLGGDCVTATTNDPAFVLDSSRNDMAPGSTQDLTDAAWTLTDVSGGASVDSATQLTFGNNGNDRLQQTITTVEGVTYTVSATLALVSGDDKVRWSHVNSATGTLSSDVTITSTPTRFELSVLGRVGGGSVSFGLYNGSTAATSVLTATDWQLEIGSSASTFTDSAESARSKGIVFDGVDDYVTADGLVASFTGEDKPFTVAMLVAPRTAFVSLDRLWSFGSSSNVSPFITVETNASGVLTYRVRDDADVTIDRAATESLTLDTWHVLVISSTGTVLSGSLDGVPLTWADTDVDIGTLTLDQFTIGAFRSTTISRQIEADIGVVPVHNRALSPGEIAQLTHEIASNPACLYRGIAEMCALVNQVAPPYGSVWREKFILAHYDPDQMWIDLGERVHAGREWDRTNVEVSQ